MTGVFLFPLLFLPGRLFSAYWYVPLTGIAVALSAVDLESPRTRAIVTGLFLLWFPWDYQRMRVERRAKLAKDEEVRVWTQTLQRFLEKSPRIDAFVFAGAPAGFQRWGIEGALKYFTRRGDLEIHWAEDKDAQSAFTKSRFAMLTWDAGPKVLAIASHTPETPDAAYLKMDGGTPVWQLGEGWFALENTFRWIRPHATVRLWRPAGAGRFELRVNIGEQQLKEVGPQQVTVAIDGARLEPKRFPKLAWQVEQWSLPPGSEGEVQVTLDVNPALHPPNETRELGIAIGGIGFVKENR
jgi:hypothetical protein